MNRKKDRVHNALTAVGIILVALVIAAFVAGGYAVLEGSRHTETCTVESKDRSMDKEGKSVYRVYSDCGVFKVEDDWFRGAFNAADTFGKLQPGVEYEFDAVGWRNGFLSLFPNIITATPVNAKEVAK